ncbi:MAG: glycosyltransferase [Balneolaceae bacterium]
MSNRFSRQTFATFDGPTVSVILPVYRDWEPLRACLDSLRAQSYPADKLEILIVNNDPEHSCPPDWVYGESTRVLEESLPGSYAARNRGVREANGEILAFTDADCIPDPDWIERGVEALLATPGLKRIAGIVKLFFRGEHPGWVEIYEKAFAFPQHSYVEEEAFGVTANLITQREVFDKTGLFDAMLYSGGDREWGQHAEAMGIPVVFTETVVIRHPARSRMGQLLQKNRRAMGGWVQRHRGQRKEILFMLARLLLPPLGTLKSLGGRRDLSVREKGIALGIHCVLKAHSFTIIMGLILRKSDYERR